MVASNLLIQKKYLLREYAILDEAHLWYSCTVIMTVIYLQYINCRVARIHKTIVTLKSFDEEYKEWFYSFGMFYVDVPSEIPRMLLSRPVHQGVRQELAMSPPPKKSHADAYPQHGECAS